MLMTATTTYNYAKAIHIPFNAVSCDFPVRFNSTKDDTNCFDSICRHVRIYKLQKYAN
jgi:hypothetical protein